MEATVEVDAIDFTELKQKIDSEIEEHAAYLKAKSSGFTEEEDAIYE